MDDLLRQEKQLDASFLNSLKIAEKYDLDTFEISNRRYLGSKAKLISQIQDEVHKNLGREPKSIFDVFAGTGIVSKKFADAGIKVIANDLLKHNYYALVTFIGTENINLENLAQKILYLNSLKMKNNYFSEHFGGTYFSVDNAKKIGVIREEINKIAENHREKAALITSLFYAADKIANTVGHYDAFHRGQNKNSIIDLRFPVISDKLNKDNEIFCSDSLVIANKFETDVAYLDPPYNSRQYSDAYHVLENLVNWHKPEVFGIAKKMDRSNLKSAFCGKKAVFAFEELVEKLNCKVIVMSYNNTSNKLNPRSNSTISDKDLIGVLKKKGEVIKKQINFNNFNSGKTKTRKHMERLFICFVGN